MELALQKTDLQYTVVRPGGLSNSKVVMGCSRWVYVCGAQFADDAKGIENLLFGADESVVNPTQRIDGTQKSVVQAEW